MNTFHAIGLMSGTSLDGLDIAYCRFNIEEDNTSFQLLDAQTIDYPVLWKEKLSAADQLGAFEFSQLDANYGKWMGEQVKSFLQDKNIQVDFVTSHGYTVFHEPNLGFTKQIGSGAHLAAASKQVVICDFRSLDVALGGEGAPLVPIGDQALFNLNTDNTCVNIGGIANFSFLEEDQLKGEDICAANLVLNALASRIGKAYDKNGKRARKGKVDKALLKTLNKIKFKGSLEALSIHQKYQDVFQDFDLSAEDLLATATEDIAVKISKKIKPFKSAFFSGGGTKNAFLMERVKKLSKTEIIIPEKEIIDFKEAIIFAYLGLKRFRNEANCDQSVTGSSYSNIGGAIYNGKH